jgi:predicted DCC family thiol-disulfide oxidoreductase YuxK
MAPLLLAYDAECSLCRTLVGWVQARDRGGLVIPFPLQNPELVRMAPELAGRELGEALHALDTGSRRVFRGGDCLAPLLARLRGWNLLAPLLRLPGVRALARRAYASLAARRHCRTAPRPFDR